MNMLFRAVTPSEFMRRIEEAMRAVVAELPDLAIWRQRCNPESLVYGRAGRIVDAIVVGKANSSKPDQPTEEVFLAIWVAEAPARYEIRFSDHGPYTHYWDAGGPLYREAIAQLVPEMSDRLRTLKRE
jgi:hypothetical protein